MNVDARGKRVVPMGGLDYISILPALPFSLLFFRLLHHPHWMASLTGHVPAFTAVHGHSPWGALLSRSLPTYSGRFKVGVREAEFPVEVERIGSFARKPIDGEDSKAGFELETILFTLFYPCEPKRNEPSKVMWFPR